MKVTLAYPHDGRRPDDTVDVDEQVGRRLIHDGKARPPDPDDPPPDDPPAGQSEPVNLSPPAGANSEEAHRGR